MSPQPLYTAANLRLPAYQLRYSWAGWFSDGPGPDPLSPDALDALKAQWESDGLRLLESKWSADAVQITFSATPQVSPLLLAARAKGRLWHALKESGRKRAFSRKVAVRTLGDPTREEVEAYIRSQVASEQIVDERLARVMQDFTVTVPDVDLSLPTETQSGRYWYNLHLVLVVADRYRIGDDGTLGTIRDQSFRIAAKKGYGISTLSVMPDHMHIAMRGAIAQSPEDIALAFLNNLAYSLGQRPVWEPGYYAGSFGEYTMRAVRGRGGLPEP